MMVFAKPWIQGVVYHNIKQRRLNDFMDRNPAQGRNRIKAVYFLRAQHWRRRAVPQDPNASDEDFETRFPLLLTTLPLMA